VGTSGISTGFPALSQSSGQVAHVLRTRSPLGLHQCCHRLNLVRLACVRHAASVRPEPGSNSPSRSHASASKLASALRSGEPELERLAPFPTGTRTDCCPFSVQLTTDDIEHAPEGTRPQSPALAFGCSYSVVKERRRDTLPGGRRCRLRPGRIATLRGPLILHSCRSGANRSSPAPAETPVRSGYSLYADHPACVNHARSVVVVLAALPSRTHADRLRQRSAMAAQPHRPPVPRARCERS
jgi:hypothetical protein